MQNKSRPGRQNMYESVTVSRVVIMESFKALALTDAKNKGSVKRSAKASQKNHCQTKSYHSLHMNRHVSCYNTSQKNEQIRYAHS